MTPQCIKAHAAIFNPEKKELTVCSVSKSRALHFHSQIHWKIHELCLKMAEKACFKVQPKVFGCMRRFNQLIAVTSVEPCPLLWSTLSLMFLVGNCAHLANSELFPLDRTCYSRFSSLSEWDFIPCLHFVFPREGQSLTIIWVLSLPKAGWVFHL